MAYMPGASTLLINDPLTSVFEANLETGSASFIGQQAAINSGDVRITELLKQDGKPGRIHDTIIIRIGDNV
ncbi:MAG: hypothetical protein JWL77_6045 [Chthonomonadaceae bacterium]|nr:hypothetical protein [Chthonomonadaceae bacterium]